MVYIGARMLVSVSGSVGKQGSRTYIALDIPDLCQKVSYAWLAVCNDPTRTITDDSKQW